LSDPALSATATEPGEESLAGLWSFTLQALVARAAHEINNALNGAVVNVEVVKARARPGADAGAAAPFAEAASTQLEELAAMTEALLALSRPPRGTPDAALIARHASALLTPGLARLGVRIDLTSARACPAGGDPTAVRLAVVSGLLAAVDMAARMAETAGTDSAVEPTRRVGCTTLSDDRPTVEIAPRYGATLPPPVARALSAVDVVVSADSEMLRIALPKRAEPY
jgi:signal transduction histidine kinase